MFKESEMIYIFDIDGTLADCTHRLHYIQKEEKNWDAFFGECWNDKPIDSVIQILNSMADRNDIRIWVFTGRSDIAKKETEEWLLDNTDLGIFKLKMRPHGDHSPDYKLKKKWLNNLAPPGSLARAEIAGVFEDRKSVCDMWRSEGIKCFQVAEGEF